MKDINTKKKAITVAIIVFIIMAILIFILGAIIDLIRQFLEKHTINKLLELEIWKKVM